MSLSFRLQLPADAAFRPLATDAATRLAQIAGGTAAEAAAFSNAVDGALGALGVGADTVDLAFRTSAGAIEVIVERGGQSRVLSGTIESPKE